MSNKINKLMLKLTKQWSENPHSACKSATEDGCEVIARYANSVCSIHLQFWVQRRIFFSVVTIASEPVSIDYDRSFEKNRDVDVDSMLHGHVD